MSTLYSKVKVGDKWMERKGPEDHVVVSSRARYARNLPKVPFPLRARPEELRHVVETVGRVLRRMDDMRDGSIFNLSQLQAYERQFLKECHLISTEMEKGSENRLLFLDADVKHGVMVNEEDHLRLFAIESGFCLADVVNGLFSLDDRMGKEVEFAFSEKYGYLTACPTNVGTGLRVSVMLHLPALTSMQGFSGILKNLPQYGLTARGYYGENSDSLGNFYQVSNEVTLGRSEEEIVRELAVRVEQLIQAEEQQRRVLLETDLLGWEDQAWRAYGLLTSARQMESIEAFVLLGKLRVGVDKHWFPGVTHAALNRLLIQIQPGHQVISRGYDAGDIQRDGLRADYLRDAFAQMASGAIS